MNATAAKGTSIPYKRWTELEFKLASHQKSIIVAFLVTKEIIDLPLVGFNAIEELIKTDMFESDLKSVFSGVPSEKMSVSDNITTT